LGRVPAETITVEYDDQDRVARLVVDREPEWTEEDVGWATAHLEELADRCPGCGEPLSETADPEAEGEYETPLPTRCHACTPLEQQKDEYKDSPPGLLFSVQRRQ
jgi:uncharacterized protein with PIN domain